MNRKTFIFNLLGASSMVFVADADYDFWKQQWEDARERGEPKMWELYCNYAKKMGREVPSMFSTI